MRRIHRYRPLVGLAATAMLTIGALGVGVVPAAQARSTAPTAAAAVAGVRYFGAWSAIKPGQTRAQALAETETAIGATLPLVTDYRAWDEGFPDEFARTVARRGGAMMVMLKLKRKNGTRPLWADLAAARPGDPLYTDLDRWAASAKRFTGPLYITFHKEPNEPANVANGTAPDFISAYRAFVLHLRAAGVHNVRYVWALPATLFGGATPAADRWYPGDDVVDVIGATGANRYGCDPAVPPLWRSFGQIFGPAHRWLAKHPAQTLAAVEFETVEDPADPAHKGQWLADAHALAGTAAWSQLEVMSYFNSSATDQGGICPWWLATSPGSLAAARAWALDPAFRGPAG
jgi:hypothetical protein